LRKWRRGKFWLGERTASSVLAAYRGLSLVVAVTVIFSLGYVRVLPYPEWLLITSVAVYTLYKIIRPTPSYARRLANHIEFGIDVVICIALPVITGGLHSPFLLYCLSPLLISALLFPRKITFSLAAWPVAAVITGELVTNGFSVTAAFIPRGLSFGLMGIYFVACCLLAWLPYLMNINTSQDIRANAIVQERKRLSRDMHDGLAQMLGIIRWRMELLRKQLAAGDTSKVLTEVSDVLNLVETAQSETRGVIEQLHTVVDTDQGFVGTLAQYATEFTQNYGIKCELHMADGEVNLSSLAELELLCVTQEALANVRKHSNASTVQVVFVTKDEGAELIIKDNGSGFDANTVPQGYGLKIMEERAKSIGGDFLAASHNWWKFNLAISYTPLSSQSIPLSNQCFL